MPEMPEKWDDNKYSLDPSTYGTYIITIVRIDGKVVPAQRIYESTSKVEADAVFTALENNLLGDIARAMQRATG